MNIYDWIPAKLSSENKKLVTPCDCNICGSEFSPESKFDRFCENCRETDETYKFAEWAIYS